MMNVGVHAPSGHSVRFGVSRESVALLHELGATLVFTVYAESRDAQDLARRIFCSLLSRQKVSKKVSPAW